MSRESAMSALVALVGAAYAWKTGPSRRLKLWADVPASARPACFVIASHNQKYTWTTGTVPKRLMEVMVFVYIDAKDPNIIGDTVLNMIIDAFDAAMKPAGADQSLGRNTLSGNAYNCRIMGSVIKDPGDLDGDGLLIVPLEIEIP